MPRSAVAGILLVIVGVIVIVIGAGMILSGHNTIQAAEAWDDLPRDQRCEYDLITRSYICPENPFQGGRSRFWAGVAVTIVGGVVLYYGTR